VYERTGVSEQKVISRTISVRTGETLYVALGDKPWVALIALIFLVGIVNRSKVRSQSRA
jgi:apolipoprotein N-acyltransferase